MTHVPRTSPREYLQDGWWDAQGRLQPHLNGQYSLGMAYRLRDEGTGPDVVQVILMRRIHAMIEQYGPPRVRINDPVHPDALSAMMAIPEVQHSPALRDLFEAACAHLHTWRDMQAFVRHLERIMAQLAWLTLWPTEIG